MHIAPYRVSPRQVPPRFGAALSGEILYRPAPNRDTLSPQYALKLSEEAIQLSQSTGTLVQLQVDENHTAGIALPESNVKDLAAGFLRAARARIKGQ